MVVNGIVAEYNPFHNGHKFQLNDSRKQTDADYTIIAMSGNFMQRGAPALLDKYRRAQMALTNGADLVLELPSIYASSSAEAFAMGAVSLLDKLGVVNHLCFGSECGSIEVLEKLARILLEEPAEYQKSLRMNLREGLSYPNARTRALLHYDASLSKYLDILSSPNNILGMEYLKALLKRKSTIAPCTTMRMGADYHDQRLGSHQSSALAIRQACFSEPDFHLLERQMPDSAYALMTEYFKKTAPMQTNDFSAVLHYKLLAENENGYEKYLDVSPELSDRIKGNLYRFRNFQDFCDLLKTKNMTYTRISRCLMHILLDMETKTFEALQEMDYIPYARVLGFKKEAAPLLTAIKENASIPLVTKLADADKILDKDAFTMLKKEIAVNHVYASTVAIKTGAEMMNEFSTPIVIV